MCLVIPSRRTFWAILRAPMARVRFQLSSSCADDLKTLGYVALTVDSLGPRDMPADGSARLPAIAERPLDPADALPKTRLESRREPEGWCMLRSMLRMSSRTQR
jgi:hypothetical protein